MFNVQKVAARLLHKAERTETHGKNDVTAFDLKLELDGSNDLLSMFSPELKRSLYRADEDKPDLLDQEQHLTVLRLGTGLREVEWEAGNLVGATVAFYYGVNEEEIPFRGAKVNNFALCPKDGGSITIKFRVQVVPDQDKLKDLSGILTELRRRKVVTITVTPPEPKAEKAPDLADKAQSEARKDAEGVFSSGGDGGGDEAPAPAAGRRRAPASVD